MRKIVIILGLMCSPAYALDHAPFTHPTPYASDQLDADKNACMDHGVPKYNGPGRHPEMRPNKPQGWEPGFEACDQIFQQWRDKVNAARALRGENPI